MDVDTYLIAKQYIVTDDRLKVSTNQKEPFPSEDVFNPLNNRNKSINVETLSNVLYGKFGNDGLNLKDNVNIYIIHYWSNKTKIVTETIPDF